MASSAAQRVHTDGGGRDEVEQEHPPTSGVDEHCGISEHAADYDEADRQSNEQSTGDEHEPYEQVPPFDGDIVTLTRADCSTSSTARLRGVTRSSAR